MNGPLLKLWETLGHHKLVSVAVALLSYLGCRVTYLLVLHPLAAFQGPRLAALTGWYTLYFDAIRGGVFLQKLERLHDRYGMIVRIGPNEIHIADPTFYDTLFNFKSSIEKPKYEIGTPILAY